MRVETIEKLETCSLINIIHDRYGRVRIRYNSFYLQGDDNNFSGEQWEAGFLSARDGYLSFFSLSNDHHAGVRVVYLQNGPSDPDLDAWDEIVECSFNPVYPPYLMMPAMPGDKSGIDEPLQDLKIRKGGKRVRASVKRGQDTSRGHGPTGDDDSPEPEKMPEQFLIEIWDNKSGEVVTGGRIVK